MKKLAIILSMLAITSLSSCDDDPSSGTCSDGDTQEGTTVCGLNDEGVLIQNCVDDTWVDSTSCTGTDVCVNEATQIGTTVCGDNSEGFFMQNCTNGQWIDDTTDCHIEPACTNGDTRNGTTVCGLNNEGFVIEECQEGEWTETTDCSGTDVCVNLAERNSDTPCDPNGVFIERCVNGAWELTDECNSTPECTTGENQPGTSACGLNGRGLYDQECINGFWQDTENCVDPDECIDNASQTLNNACGFNNHGSLEQNCVLGAWVDGTCTETDDCQDGTSQTLTNACGFNNNGSLEQNCVSGAWVDGTCTETDDCQDGTSQTLNNACGFNNHGSLEQNCVSGAWVDGTCTETDDCENGTSQTLNNACGFNNNGSLEQNCVSGAWVDGTCTETDDCENSTTQTGTTPCGYNNSGRIEQLCSDGAWVDTANCINEGFIFLNEVVTGATGWVELHNGNSSEADISGWIINVGGTDHTIPASTTIPANGYYVFENININPDNDMVTLYVGTTEIDSTDWTTNQPIWGRFPNGTGNFQTLYINTMAAENTDLQPVSIGWCGNIYPVAINETVGYSTDIYGKLYISGYTDTYSDAISQVRSRMCWTDGTNSECENASFAGTEPGVPNNDQYMVNFTFENVGTYTYWYEFSGDMGNTWTSCIDFGATGGGVANITNGSVTWESKLYLWEVDSDTPGTDVAEFIELWNNTGSTIDFSTESYFLILINGSNDLTYATIQLSGTLNDGDIFTIGSPSMTGINQSFSLASNFLQNGQDGVILIRCDGCTAAEIPINTVIPATTTFSVGSNTATKVDGIAYDTADADDANLMSICGVTTQWNESENATPETDSLHRTSPDTWSTSPSTPTVK